MKPCDIHRGTYIHLCLTAVFWWCTVDDCLVDLCADNCEQVKSIVFDKTGTLTHGIQRVSHVVMFVRRTDFSLHTVLAIAGSAESSSEHPIGAAIVSYVKKVVFFILVVCGF